MRGIQVHWGCAQRRRAGVDLGFQALFDKEAPLKTRRRGCKGQSQRARGPQFQWLGAVKARQGIARSPHDGAEAHQQDVSEADTTLGLGRSLKVNSISHDHIVYTNVYG